MEHLVCLAEVKCPYKARTKSIDEMYCDPSFCCALVNALSMLKQNNDYYYQIRYRDKWQLLESTDVILSFGHP